MGNFLFIFYISCFCDLTEFTRLSWKFYNITIQTHYTSTQIAKLIQRKVYSITKTQNFMPCIYFAILSNNILAIIPINELLGNKLTDFNDNCKCANICATRTLCNSIWPHNIILWDIAVCNVHYSIKYYLLNTLGILQYNMYWIRTSCTIQYNMY